MTRPNLVLAVLAGLLLSGCAGGSGGANGTSGPARAPDDDLGMVEGVVVDDEQVPVAGADVWLETDALRRTITQNDGSFAFARIAPGEHPVNAEAAGFRSSRVVASVVAGETARITLILSPIPKPEPRSASYVADAIIEMAYNVMGVKNDFNESGTDYRDIYYDVTSDVQSAASALQWTASSPLSAKWMYLGLHLADRQCARVCDLVDAKTGRSPLVARAWGLDALAADRGGNLTVNPYITIQAPCLIATIDTCPQNPDAIAQVALDQRFKLYTAIFFVEPGPADFNPLPPG